MKTFGTKILIAVICIFNGVIFGQTCFPTVQICNKNDCGGVGIALATDENNVFCQGQNVVIKIDTANSSKFDEYYVYWCDGVVDTLPGDVTSFDHIYDVSEEEICKSPSSDYFLYVIGTKTCDAGRSCRSLATTVTLMHEPRAKFTYSNTVCIDKTVNFNNQSCNVDGQKLNAYKWYFDDGTTSNEKNPSKKYNTTGFHQVKLVVSNDCGSDSVVNLVSVVDYPDALVQISENLSDSVICVGDRVTFIDKSNIWSGLNRWTFPSNPHTSKTNWSVLSSILKKDSLSIGTKDSVIYIDTVIIDFHRTGTYVFTLTSTNDCATRTWRLPITVVDRPIVNFSKPKQFCQTARYKPELSTSGNIKSYEWQFPGGNPGTSNMKDPGEIVYDKPGVYDVFLRVFAPCDTLTFSEKLVVIGKDSVDLQFNFKNYCQSDDPDTIAVNILGGSFSGLGIIDSKFGVFDPGLLQPGTHEFKYTVGPQGCQSTGIQSINIIQAQTVVVSDTLLCENSQIVQIYTSYPGGIFSGSPFIDSSGFFSPTIDAIGANNVIYNVTDFNGCKIQKNAKVLVERLPVLSLKDSILVCIGGGMVNLLEVFDAKVDSAGSAGYFDFYIKNIQSNSILDLDNVSADTLDISIFYTRNACRVGDTSSMIFIEQPRLTLSEDTIICIAEEELELLAEPAGGDWQGPGIDPQTGIIDLKKVGKGTQTYIYTLAAKSSCEISDEINVEVLDPSSSLSAGPDLEICFASGFYQLEGQVPIGGIWVGSGINPQNGMIDLSAIKKDSTYVYKYCVEDSRLGSCQACSERNFLLRGLPNASIEQEGKLCENNNIVFSAIDNTSNQYQWFIDGINVGSGKEIGYKFDIPGEHEVKLITKDIYNCESELVEKLVVIKSVKTDFDFDQDGACVPVLIEPSNKSTGDEINYLWEFNGDTSLQSLPVFFIDSLIKDTIFTIKLLAGNSCNQDSITKSIELKSRPIADFGFEITEGCSPFNAVLMNASYGEPTSLSWDFGDGTTSNSFDESHHWFTSHDSVEIYIIKLRLENGCGTDSLEKTISVFPPNVNAFIEQEKQSYCIDEQIVLQSFSTPGAQIFWKTLDAAGNERIMNDKTLQLYPQVPGKLTVILYVSSCGTDTDTAFFDIKPLPSVDFDWTQPTCTDTEINFNMLQGHEASNILWDFGDGNSSTDVGPRFAFSDSGRYIVSLTLLDANTNCGNNIQKEIEIKPRPESQFLVDKMESCPPLTPEITKLQSNTLDHYWELSDGRKWIGELPSFQLETSGQYIFRHYTKDEYGCLSDTSKIQFTVHNVPKADFILNKNEFCGVPAVVKFDNASLGAFETKWALDGMELGSMNEGTQTINQLGSHVFLLVATNENRCKDSIFKEVTIYTKPIAAFTIEEKVCSGQKLTISNNSLNATNYYWEINGDAYNSKQPEIIIAEEGEYDAQLVVSTNDLCFDTLKQMLAFTVYRSPKADFTYSTNFENNTLGEVKFDNLSIDYVSNFWDFGDGSVSNEVSPYHEYNKNREIDVSLVVANETGDFVCFDTLTKSIAPEWLVTFFAPNAFSPGYGIGDVQIFKPVGLGLSQYQIDVYSPWGTNVWSSSKLDNNGSPVDSWDGSFKGHPVPQGAYTWQAKLVFVNGKSEIKTGSVTVLR